MTSNTSLSTPALIISLGDFSTQTARQIRSIYLRGDPKRSLITDFFSVARDKDGCYSLADGASPKAAIPAAASHESQAEQNRPAFRKAVYIETVQSAFLLRGDIEKALYAIRAHERLIEAGWAEEYDVPINIFLLTDAADPASAGIFFPICRILQELAGNIHRCQIHILLTSAFFPGGAAGQEDAADLEIYTFLLDLNEFLNEKSERRDALDQALGIEGPLLADPTIYLFDRHKEGSAVVKDQEKVQLMLGNALLALLLKDTARRVAWGEQDSERAVGQNYYCGIGASVWAYDPASLQEACAGKLTAEFLAQGLLHSGENPLQKALLQVEQIQQGLGRFTSWLEEAVFQTHPSIGQTNIHPETGELSVLLTDLVLPDIEFLQISQTAWASLIPEYQRHFESEVLPEIQTVLKVNVDALLESRSKSLRSALDRLLTDPDLYPGGPKNTMRAVDLLAGSLAREQERGKSILAGLQVRQVEAKSRVEQGCQEIQRLVAQAPKLPWPLRGLPRFARIFIAPLFFAWRFGKQLIRLQALRTEAVGLIQSICADHIQAAALLLIDRFIAALLAEIEIGENEVNIFQDKLTSIQSKFLQEWPSFPLGSAENGWDPVFRRSLLPPFLAVELFQKWRPNFGEWARRFVNESGLFADWRSASPESLAAWIVSQARESYQPLWKLSLSDIIELQEANSFAPASPSLSELAAHAQNAALPLLRPDFDAAGGNSSSTISRHLLIGEPEFALSHRLTQSPQLNGWEICYTGDPYLAIFLQVRHEVCLPSLVDMIRHGKRKYHLAAAHTKREYQILGPVDLSRKNPDPGLTDGEGADTIQKEFVWSFKPRGAAKEVKQKISLEISRPRFEHYRRLPRLAGKWNDYAEEEMPEIRALATEFQKLHAAQNWSTYNQAFNILKFTQACVPYTRDIDTTGFEDWARYPIETLVEETGDCEDVAILCAAIIARLGFQVVLLLYPRHLAFGVAGADQLKGDYITDPSTGKRYFYGEATSEGWHLGQIPAEYRGQAPKQILPVNILIKEED